MAESSAEHETSMTRGVYIRAPREQHAFHGREAPAYGRGGYAPLDRETHWGVSWGVDEVSGYTADRVLDRTLRPVLPAIGTASRTVRGARGVWLATRELGGRDTENEPLHQVGATWFHTVADRKRALAQLRTEFAALSADLAIVQTRTPNQTTAQWLAADVTPTLDEWHAFYDREIDSWWARAATSWDTYEEWFVRLKRLRELARAHGVALESPEPAPLPKTIWEKGATGEGNEAAAWLGILKIVVLAGIGVTGFVTLYSALREVARPRQ